MEENWYFEVAQKYFKLGEYKDVHIRRFVLADRITKSQFKEITGNDYDEPSVVPVKANI